MPVKRISEKLRQRVIERARGYCEYCRCPDSVSTSPFAVDHIIPKARGGKTVLRNLAYACQGCNGKKRDKMQAIDPFTGEMVDLFHPLKQKWSDHFAWNEDFTLMIGLTPTGRATLDRFAIACMDRVSSPRVSKGLVCGPALAYARATDTAFPSTQVKTDLVALDLNRAGVVNLRKLLLNSNQHPLEE